MTETYRKAPDAWIDEALAECREREIKPPRVVMRLYLRREQARVCVQGRPMTPLKTMVRETGYPRTTLRRMLQSCDEWSDPLLTEAWLVAWEASEGVDPQRTPSGPPRGPGRARAGRHRSGAADPQRTPGGPPADRPRPHARNTRDFGDSETQRHRRAVRRGVRAPAPAASRASAADGP